MKHKRDAGTANGYKSNILHPYIYDKTQQDLVTCCILLIRREMSKIISSFFQLDGYFYLSSKIRYWTSKERIGRKVSELGYICGPPKRDVYWPMYIKLGEQGIVFSLSNSICC